MDEEKLNEIWIALNDMETSFLLNIIKLKMTFLNLSKILNKNISVYDKITYSN